MDKFANMVFEMSDFIAAMKQRNRLNTQRRQVSVEQPVSQVCYAKCYLLCRGLVDINCQNNPNQQTFTDL